MLTAADAAAQLVQLRESEALGILDDHERGVRHVDADFDHRGRHQELDFSVLEAPHGAFLRGGRHAAVNQPDAELGQRRGQGRGGFLGGLVGHLLGFIDERADPVRLPSFETGGSNPLHHLVAARLGQHHGLHGRAARRQLVDHRDIEIGVGGHRQRARNRRRGHDQLMRLMPMERAFFAQAQALMHAEAMLLVDDDQGERGELDALLKQRMCADDDGRMPGADPLQARRCAPCRFAARVKSATATPKRLEPAPKILCMLVGQKFGRRHERRLPARLHGLRRGQRRNQGLAAAHVALHQAQHRFGLPEIALDLAQRPWLAPASTGTAAQPAGWL